jgi:hypothetical protein
MEELHMTAKHALKQAQAMFGAKAHVGQIKKAFYVGVVCGPSGFQMVQSLGSGLSWEEALTKAKAAGTAFLIPETAKGEKCQ